MIRLLPGIRSVETRFNSLAKAEDFMPFLLARNKSVNSKACYSLQPDYKSFFQIPAICLSYLMRYSRGKIAFSHYRYCWKTCAPQATNTVKIRIVSQLCGGRGQTESPRGKEPAAEGGHRTASILLPISLVRKHSSGRDVRRGHAQAARSARRTSSLLLHPQKLS